MNISIALGLVLGVTIGGIFAWLQMLALHRNELMERNEHVPALLRQIPGSMGRCAFLLIALAGVQVLFPSASLPWMSAGFFVSYSLPFIWRLKEKYLHR